MWHSYSLKPQVTGEDWEIGQLSYSADCLCYVASKSLVNFWHSSASSMSLSEKFSVFSNETQYYFCAQKESARSSKVRPALLTVAMS